MSIGRRLSPPNFYEPAKPGEIWGMGWEVITTFIMQNATEATEATEGGEKVGGENYRQSA